MTPEWVNPEKLHDVWPWVREGLEVVRRRAHANWLPEDVYTALKGRTAELFLIEDRGFIVLSKSADYGGPTLFIWAIYGELAELEEQVYEWLRGVRDKGGFRSVWWMSPRRWDVRKYARLKQYVYELE